MQFIKIHSNRIRESSWNYDAQISSLQNSYKFIKKESTDSNAAAMGKRIPHTNVVFGLKIGVRFSMCSKSSDYLNVSRFLALNKRSFTYYLCTYIVHIVLPASCLYALHLMPRNSEKFRINSKFIRCQHESRIYKSTNHDLFFWQNLGCDLYSK